MNLDDDVGALIGSPASTAASPSSALDDDIGALIAPVKKTDRNALLGKPVAPQPDPSDSAGVLDKVRAAGNTLPYLAAGAIAAPASNLYGFAKALLTGHPDQAESNASNAYSNTMDTVLGKPDPLTAEYLDKVGQAFDKSKLAGLNPMDATVLAQSMPPAAVLSAALATRRATSLLPESAPMNPVRAATQAEVQNAGYVLPPSIAGGGVGSRMLEGLSGQAKTKQLAQMRAQAVTENLARQSIGLPKDTPLTSDAVQGVIKNAYDQGYAPIANIGTMPTDSQYGSALDGILSKFRGASASFPDAIPDNVSGLVDSYRVGQFDSGDALQASQALRDVATSAFSKGDSGLGKAARSVSKAIEDQVERNLTGMGADGEDMLSNFRDSRQLMAKAYTVNDAIRQGAGTIDAKVFGRRLQAKKPLSDEGLTIGKFANTYPEIAGIPKAGDANPFSVLDYFSGMLGPETYGATLALPLARVAARYGILSKPYQQRFLMPKGALTPAAAAEPLYGNQEWANMLPNDWSPLPGSDNVQFHPSQEPARPLPGLPDAPPVIPGAMNTPDARHGLPVFSEDLLPMSDRYAGTHMPIGHLESGLADYSHSPTLGLPPSAGFFGLSDQESARPYAYPQSDMVDFPLRQEVLQQPLISNAIDQFRQQSEDLQNIIKGTIDPRTKAAAQEKLDALQQRFGVGMKSLGIRSPQDATGMLRRLYQSGEGTQAPIGR